MLGWFRSKAKCPVDPVAREWIDTRWAWLENEFGIDLLRSRPVILPNSEFFPEPYNGKEEEVPILLDRMCRYMEIDPTTVELSLYDDRNRVFVDDFQQGTAGLYHQEGDKFHICIEVNNLHDPLAIVATIAHELGHVHLLGHGRISEEEIDHEPLTDLLSVFLGMGALTANSVIRELNWNSGNWSGWSMSRMGYLRLEHFGYAFAKFARSRNETGKDWASHLRLDVRTSFKQAMRFLAEESLNSQIQ